MKIISGKYKGRKLEGFDILGTRPTMERVKESLFAMIQNQIAESIVLDLFSGSGNLGIEALSQGAAQAHFVDENKKAYQTISKNLAMIGLENNTVLNLDYQAALKFYDKKNIKFDLIFLDPPYQTEYIKTSLKLIDDYQLLKENGKVIAESSDINKIVFPKTFEIVKQKKYGDKWVAILRRI